MDHPHSMQPHCLSLTGWCIERGQHPAPARLKCLAKTPPGSAATLPRPAAESAAAPAVENSSPGCAQCASKSFPSGLRSPAGSSRCGNPAAFLVATHTAPSRKNGRAGRSDSSSKNRCHAWRVCLYRPPQKPSFSSLRKCSKCSSIGIIFATGCRSPFQERLRLLGKANLHPLAVYTINVTSPRVSPRFAVYGM